MYWRDWSLDLRGGQSRRSSLIELGDEIDREDGYCRRFQVRLALILCNPPWYLLT